MKVEIEWHRPVQLLDGTDQNLIYKTHDLEIVPASPGVYIFCRRFGKKKKYIPLYIGKAGNLRNRVKGELNNVKLMKGIEKEPNGKRLLLFCTIHSKPGLQSEKAIKAIEDGLIEHAIDEGYEVLNDKGTKRPYNVITTNRLSRNNPFPKLIRAIPRAVAKPRKKKK